MKINEKKYTAIILLGGKGARMGSLTKKNPKSLLKINKFTILSHIYTQLRLINISKIIFCLGYKKQKIINYCTKQLNKDSDKILNILKKKKNYYKPNIYFSILTENNSTSERLYKAKRFSKDQNVIILYGDTLLKLDIKKYRSYLMNKPNFDILLTLSNPKEKFGVAKLNKQRVIAFSEKNIDKKKWVNSGWMILTSKVFNKIKKKSVNFENYIFDQTKKLKILAFKNKNFYLPIDNVKDLIQAEECWKKNKKTWY